LANKPSGSFSEYSIAGFLDELGSASASPGGGSAAALTGALGVALIQMVFNINNRRSQKTETLGVHPKNLTLTEIREQFERFELLMTLDAEVFANLSKFIKDERSGNLYQEALKKAADVPLEMARSAYRAMALGEKEIDRTSRWLASDLAEAGILLEASFNSARLNVEINLKSIQDTSYISKSQKELDDLQKKVTASKKKLSEVFRK